ncbi:MAG: zinc ABC transporter substrate-binding protein [Cyanobacteria bacterium P01_D01_bin.105]
MFQRTVWAAVGIVSFGLGSCAVPSTTSETDSVDAELDAASEDTLQVVTTFLPMTQFATAVAGDRAEVIQLLPTNVGPHDYQAKPGDVQAIANADVLIKNGLEMEFFLDDMIENAGNADLAIIDSSEGVATLASTGDHGHKDEAHGHKDDAHDHAEEEHHHEHAEGEHHDEHAEGEHHDEHAEGEPHDEHAHGEYDPHIWLDPKRVIEQVENIRDGLIAADPEGEADYMANADGFIVELTALDADITETLAPFAGETFVVFHDFPAYFADSYGLQYGALVGIPEENPSPGDVKRVMETVQAEGLKTLLTEPQVEETAFKAITDDLGISISEFNPMETGEAEAIQPNYYLDIMRQNAENLAAGFENPDQAWLPIWQSFYRPLSSPLSSSSS